MPDEPRGREGSLRTVPPEAFPHEVVQSPVPTLVAFSAEWCAPCAWLEPYLVEVARAGSGRIRVLKVDADEAPDLLDRHRVFSLPTVIHFEAGREVSRSLGIEPEWLRCRIGPEGEG